MALNYEALRSISRAVSTEFSHKDTILYALGVGAEELEFVYEDGLQALPTLAGVAAYAGFIWRDEEFGLDWRKILHVEQSITLHSPVPPSGTYKGNTTIDAVVDKGQGKGALIYNSRKIYDENGNHFATSSSVIFARGDGGFGGTDIAPMPREFPNNRPHDLESALKTAPNQAMIYRLSGDYNPLHIDPETAKAGGFNAPILHGMCSFGVAGRVLLKLLCDNQPWRFKSMSCRFTAPVYPGETIAVEIWHDGANCAHFRAKVQERDVTVLGNGYCEFE